MTKRLTLRERCPPYTLSIEEEDILDQESIIGQYVAIREGQVIDSGPNEMALVQRVYEKFGYGPMYVRKVGVPLPVRRIGSPRIVRQ